ncbi:MAG TPA: hypothetical protein VIG25_18610 [Pyrinomonadaceae bacterium]|jgi:hypothetical protein
MSRIKLNAGGRHSLWIRNVALAARIHSIIARPVILQNALPPLASNELLAEDYRFDGRLNP